MDACMVRRWCANGWSSMVLYDESVAARATSVLRLRAAGLSSGGGGATAVAVDVAGGLEEVLVLGAAAEEEGGGWAEAAATDMAVVTVKEVLS